MGKSDVTVATPDAYELAEIALRRLGGEPPKPSWASWIVFAIFLFAAGGLSTWWHTGHSADSEALAKLRGELESLSGELRGELSDTFSFASEGFQELRAVINTSPQAPVAAAPIGCVVAWPVAVAPPAGWMICKGDELPVADYPEIAALLDATYDAVGPGKVKLPDFRGYFLRGFGKTAPRISAEFGEPQADMLKQHGHEVNHNAAFRSDRTSQSDRNGSVNAKPASITVGNVTGALAGAETRPANYAVHWIIRVK